MKTKNAQIAVKKIFGEEIKRNGEMPDCQNNFWMDNVLLLAVDVDDLVSKRLKEFNITLTPKQEDQIHNKVWEVLEEVSNGDYRNQN